ncbi:NADP-dependent malic enzyme [Clostridium tertium]|uniref:NAD(P)-dependent malic enzyme n=1 Tax=Clostridium tertium TaxID=1559 RepID=UPI00232BDF2E|nr:NADP-dependent malic enzyme [Clostridium tertium]MDB1954950.1 NADP-dependent malic enzyme [Clostridium tertium]MDB1960180.1 NADP-dependent malic enzyme [Clostridium tertium]MDB1963961.1 NADP-dependent malic enzyme [Clostridium tertium]MDB1966647.1 NADP-dependent malic enzyme [Clostridium tertium]
MKEKSLQAHEMWKGKIEVISRCPVNNNEDLTIAYTPGVSYPCLEIEKDKEASYKYTRRSNLVGVITDGSAVLGLGNIGSLAAMPVMEGKCVLFKEFAGVDAFPICINNNDVDVLVNTIKLIEGSFGAINLEDISAPRCFEIEEKLNEICDIPVFHDDQHGTAIAVLAALLNAKKVVKKDFDIKIVVNGAGAAGIAIANLIYDAGFHNVVICDRYGIITSDNASNKYQEKCAIKFNKNKAGSLKDALVNSDVFIGVSAGNILTKEMAMSMNSDSIIFALANPIPEIMPEVAKEANVKVIATGRSDYPNQINNLLVFPGIIKGALKARVNKITTEMQLEVAKGISNCIDEDKLNSENIIPSVFDKRIVDLVCDIICSFKK